MDVHARLPSGLPDVYTNVVTVGRVFAFYEALRLVQQIKHGQLFFVRHVKEACDMALWDSEYVSATQRVAVVAHVGEVVLQYDVSWVHNSQAAESGAVFIDSWCLTPEFSGALTATRGARR